MEIASVSEPWVTAHCDLSRDGGRSDEQLGEERGWWVQLVGIDPSPQETVGKAGRTSQPTSCPWTYTYLDLRRATVGGTTLHKHTDVFPATGGYPGKVWWEVFPMPSLEEDAATQASLLLNPWF